MKCDDYEVDGVRIRIQDDGRFELEDWDDGLLDEDEEDEEGDYYDLY